MEVKAIGPRSAALHSGETPAGVGEVHIQQYAQGGEQGQTSRSGRGWRRVKLCVLQTIPHLIAELPSAPARDPDVN